MSNMIHFRNFSIKNVFEVVSNTFFFFFLKEDKFTEDDKLHDMSEIYYNTFFTFLVT